jgi:transposase
MCERARAPKSPALSLPLFTEARGRGVLGSPPASVVAFHSNPVAAKDGVTVDWEKLLPPRGFISLPRRWVVERTFAWLCHNRRMSKDYERLCSTGEALVYAAMTRLMVRRLAHA